MTINKETLNNAFAALADPTRRAILVQLSAGSADVSQLVKPFGLSQPTISKHLQVLERAGFIEQDRDAQRRPRRLTARAFKDIDAWITPFREQWNARFDNLDKHLRHMKGQRKVNAP